MILSPKTPARIRREAVGLLYDVEQMCARQRAINRALRVTEKPPIPQQRVKQEKPSYIN
jgi:hypothetical protein